MKGKKNKYDFVVNKYDKDREEIVLDNKSDIFRSGDKILCTFELRGMNFFSEVVYLESISGHPVLHFNGVLFKSEKRSSFRLLTFPMYEVNAEFDLGNIYEGGNVYDLKDRTNQTRLFKNFLKIVGNNNQDADVSKLTVRVQDLSTSGLSLHVSELEYQYFAKDLVFQNVGLNFKDETIIIPELKVVYVVDFISHDKGPKRFKVGIHFENLPAKIDDQIGKKINFLLRQNNQNKDFENFIK